MILSTLDDLIEEVQGIVQDDSKTDEDTVIKHFNRALYSLASIITIKSLIAVDNIDTTVGSNVALLPGNFMRKLKICFNVGTKKHIRVYKSKVLMNRRAQYETGVTGKIFGVAADGINLYYQRIPVASEELQITYLRIPDDVSITFPNYIPEDILSKLFINFTCEKIFSGLEDGMEGEKVNTAYHRNERKEAITEAKIFFGPDDDEPYVPLEQNAFPNNFNFNALM